MTEMHTTEKLALALEALDDPALTGLIARARDGYYHDFLSPLAFPAVELVADLYTAGHDEFVHRVNNGEFDASSAEADAWARSPEGQQAFNEVLGGGKKE